MRLAACGDGQALLADLDGALTLVNEAVRRGPGASLRRSPRVAARARLQLLLREGGVGLREDMLDEKQFAAGAQDAAPVSYTHLTLPTICSV